MHSVEGSDLSTIESAPGLVFDEPANSVKDCDLGVKPAQSLPNTGWDTMSRRGARVLDSRDAEKLRTLKDTKASPKADDLSKNSASKKSSLHSFQSLGIFDWAVITLTVILLSLLANEISLACAYRDSMRAGIKALDDNDPPLASKYFTASIHTSPRSSEPYYYRAFCEMPAGALELAGKDLDKAIELDKSNLKALVARATLSMQLKHYDSVVKDCSSILLLEPDSLDAYRLRASAYNHQMLYSKSIADSTAFLRLYPVKDSTRADVLAKRAYAYDRQHKYAAAIKDYTEAIVCDHRNASYLSSRAIVFMHSHNWKKAIADCNRAIALNPSSPASYKVRSHCHDMLKLPAHALADLNKLVALHPTVDTRRTRGNKRLSIHDYLGSMEDFDYVLDQDPADKTSAAKYEKAKTVLQARVNKKAKKTARIY